MSGSRAGALAQEADTERRFGGLRRLYGDAGYQRLRAARVVVVGLGGVGSWTAEAFARSGVAELWLVDLDHVSESNINRQVQALGDTVGRAKAVALAERIAGIHPDCRVHAVEAFVEQDNWPALLQAGGPFKAIPDGSAQAAVDAAVGPALDAVVDAAVGPAPDAVVDACDQVHAKAVLAAWARATGVPLVTVGAAGGKRHPERVEVADLADVTHDPLLASVRQRLRQRHGAPRGDGRRVHRMGLACVFSREPVSPPPAECLVGGGSSDGGLNCHGLGSTVTVTASFGLVAANAAIEAILRQAAKPSAATLARPEVHGI